MKIGLIKSNDKILTHIMLAGEKTMTTYIYIKKELTKYYKDRNKGQRHIPG